jgi:hypothetical protein
MAQQLLRWRGERGNDDQQRHHGQILEQQDADDASPMQGIEFEALCEELCQDGSRRHGKRAAKRESALP